MPPIAERKSKREVLLLYREILKLAKSFYWANDKGEPWSVVLRESARKEFREARHEKDPLAIARMVYVGWHCLNDMRSKFNVMEEQIKKRIEVTKVKR